ncbi:hypothetical protein NQ318_005814 [Aromia moschata]|uniref:GRIP domain-containing protein n=1 Tax=Aromia moschata TaxID=1265417 RepID=A0AAV8YRY1_9CUCU|nr:hypothetical protein NQ318_005814 [Aromia moschata]
MDETLVTLSHCAELSTSTEVEYLKNVVYNYMLGKESMVLARVIAAVCKFDPGADGDGAAEGAAEADVDQIYRLD